jgi:hypothetical protein
MECDELPRGRAILQRRSQFRQQPPALGSASRRVALKRFESPKKESGRRLPGIFRFVCES